MRENAEFSIKVIIVSNKHGAAKNPETQRPVSLRAIAQKLLQL